MTVGAMTEIDRALLVSEWCVPDFDERGAWSCPSCRSGLRYGHKPDCAHDAALAGRGYPDQTSRDRARALLSQASETTLVPPSPSVSIARDIQEALNVPPDQSHCPSCNYPDGPNGQHFKGIYTPGRPCDGCGQMSGIS